MQWLVCLRGFSPIRWGVMRHRRRNAVDLSPSKKELFRHSGMILAGIHSVQVHLDPGLRRGDGIRRHAHIKSTALTSAGGAGLGR